MVPEKVIVPAVLISMGVAVALVATPLIVPVPFIKIVAVPSREPADEMLLKLPPIITLLPAPLIVDAILTVKLLEKLMSCERVMVVVPEAGVWPF